MQEAETSVEVSPVTMFLDCEQIAVVSPYNGTVSGPGLSSDGGAELTSVSGGGSMLQGFAGAVTNGPSAHLPPKAEAVQLQLDAAVLEGDRTKIGGKSTASQLYYAALAHSFLYGMLHYCRQDFFFQYYFTIFVNKGSVKKSKQI